MITPIETCLDLNEAFHRYNSLGMTRQLQARAGVTQVQSPNRGIRVVLLVDYTTSAWDPRMASAQAVAAEFLFDGMSERIYLAKVREAKSKFGAATEQQAKAAQMEALRLLIASPDAVCIFRDDAVLSNLAEPLACSLVQVPSEIVDCIKAAALYDGQQPLNGIYGHITAEAVSQQVRSTLAVGRTCFTEDRLASEQDTGEHPNWTFVRARAA